MCYIFLLYNVTFLLSLFVDSQTPIESWIHMTEATKSPATSHRSQQTNQRNMFKIWKDWNKKINLQKSKTRTLSESIIINKIRFVGTGSSVVGAFSGSGSGLAAQLSGLVAQSCWRAAQGSRAPSRANTRVTYSYVICKHMKSAKWQTL